MSGIIGSVRQAVKGRHGHAPVVGGQGSGEDAAPIHHHWTVTRMLRSYMGDWLLVIGLW
jgi:hypothetical protein